MHELSVCQALIGQVEQLAREQHARRIGRIELSVGPLSGVEPALLAQAYPVAAAGTLAEDAELHIAAAPVRVHCSLCDRDSEASVNRLLCAHCGAWQTSLISGDELLLTRVEFFREQANV